ncbi:MAG TPA: DUF6264 family protein [Mycobacterium sp.]
MSNDPAAQHPSAQHTSGRRLADVNVTIVLLVAHFIFFTATFTVLGLMVMTTDSCGYQKCGDPVWLDRAMHLALWAGGAFLFLDVLVTVIRLVRQRVAWVVPLIGCIAQLAVALGAAAMEMQAGPI